MQRRDFIRLSTRTALALGLSGMGSPLWAGSTTTTPKTLIHVMLDGGPDFRHLIVPAYESSNNDAESYAAKFWSARASLFRVSTATELKEVYRNYYDEIEIDGVKCGILKQASWLKSEIAQGRVAIISNAIGSTNRNHHHAKLMIESGNMNSSPYNQDVSGWMGRAASGLKQTVVSVTSEVRLLCNGPHPTDIQRHDNSCVVNNYESREVGLYEYDTQADLDSGSSSYKYSENAIMSRALKSYYEAKRGSIPTNSPYYKAMQHEQRLRTFGRQVKTRLDANPIPQKILNLSEANHIDKLHSHYLATEIGSVYDSFVTQDIFDMRLMSMEVNGWDSHKNLRNQIEPKYEDMFGENRGFHALVDSLNAIDTALYENTLIVFSGEFGRQHKSNGDHGNDHGRGNTVLVMGGAIKKGGLYGDLFPESEKPYLDVKNADIEGKTSMLKIYSTLLEWQQQGLGEAVFGTLSTHSVESGVVLSDMFG